MTTRERRDALFYLDNQGMTVKELRQMLFTIEDQDAELEMGFAMWCKTERPYNVQKARLARLQEA